MSSLDMNEMERGLEQRLNELNQAYRKSIETGHVSYVFPYSLVGKIEEAKADLREIGSN